MTFLGLEFSSETRSVAVARQGRVLSRAEETGGRSTRAFAMIEEALKTAGIEREEIEAIAVGLGPGSYTGIRVAISIAQGWEMALGVRLTGVSTADCLAVQAAASGLRGAVHVMIDAQRNEFYHATYEIAPERHRVTTPLRLISRNEAQKMATEGVVVCVPESAEPFPTGRALVPDAGILVQLAAARSEFLSGHLLQPIYLREVSFVKAAPPRANFADSSRP